METFNHSDANQILSMTIYSEVLDEYLQMNGNWTKLWGLRIPQKVTVFLWCAVRGCLPTRQQLQSRGVNCLDSSL